MRMLHTLENGFKQEIFVNPEKIVKLGPQLPNQFGDPIQTSVTFDNGETIVVFGSTRLNYNRLFTGLSEEKDDNV